MVWTEEQVIKFLRSIETLKLVNGELEFTFNDGSGETCCIHEFEPKSLTRGIMSAIEYHMTPLEER